MIRKKTWQLSIGQVELFDDKLTVHGETDYKGLDKKYKELTAGLSDPSKMVLMNTLEKKKVRVYQINKEQRAELDGFFTKLGDREGVKGENVEEREREPARASSTIPPAGKGGDSQGKLVAMIEEIINHEMAHDGTVKSAKGVGSISVVNKADKQPVWDIDINVDGGDDTNLEGREFHVSELRAGEVWKKEYGMAFKDGTLPPVSIVEEINTAPGGTQPSLVYVLDADEKGQDTAIKLTLANKGQKLARGVTVSKQVAELFREITIGTASRGEAKRDAGEIVWTAGDLGPDETATLELKARAFAKEITAYTSGEIDVSYEVEADTHVSMKAEQVLLGGSTAFSLDLDERDTEPDVWDGQVKIQNRSEFPMHLGEIVLKFETDGGEVKPVTLEANADVDPGREWTSEKFTIESVDEPGFKDNVVAIFKDVAVGFTVTPDIVQKTSYSTWIEPIDLHVLALVGTKTFDAYAVKSYRDNLLHAVIDVKTRGVAPVASIHVEDTVPHDFANPDAKEIAVFIAGQKVDPKLYTVAFSGDDITAERKMTVDIKGINERFGDIEDGTSIQVKYPVMVHQPKQDATYKTESLFQAFLTLPGPPIECKMETSQTVTVVHQRRKTTVGKSIAPGTAKGEYLVALVYKNKANFDKTGVKVSDFVPKDFAVSAQKPDCETTKRSDGTMLIWTFDVEAGKEVELAYAVRGKTDEASLKAIEARAFK
jgi:hypothetical protein